MALSVESLVARARMVCASDVPAILNQSPFLDSNRDSIMRDKLEVIRTGVAPNRKDTQATRRGSSLEATVAQLCLSEEMGPGYMPRQPSEVFPAEWFICGNTMVHADRPAYGATLDFIVCDHDGRPIDPILNQEVKTSNSWDGWTAGQPRHVWIQVQWQMFVLLSRINVEAPRTLTSALVCSDPVRRWSGYDEGFIRSILPSVDRFLADLASHEVNGTSPEVMVPEKRAQIDVPADVTEMAERLVEVKRQIAALEVEEAALNRSILDNVRSECYGVIRTREGYVAVQKKMYGSVRQSEKMAALHKIALGGGGTESQIREQLEAIEPPEKKEVRSLYVRIKSVPNREGGPNSG